MLTSLGAEHIILAAVTADSDLVINSVIGVEQGYDVWPMVTASPYFEQGDFQVALQNLEVVGIPAKTVLNLSKSLLHSDPSKLSDVNQVYSTYIAGSSLINTGGNNTAAGNSTTVPDNSTTPADNTTAPTGGRRFL